MSTYRFVHVICPGCDIPLPTPVLRSIRARRLVAVREDILAGRHGRLRCPVCGTVIQVETESVYLDTLRRQFVGVALPRDAARPAVARARFADAYHQAIEGGPPPAQEVGLGVVHRVVFGVSGLREKLLLWDAGLDDRSVEAGKLRLIRELALDPSSVAAMGEPWRVDSILDGGHLLCRRADGAIELLPAGYCPPAEEASREAPWLTDDWLVDATLGPALV